MLLPLSLWPRRRILTSGFVRMSLFSILSISSMLSLTRFASSSASSLRTRSAGVSFWGGWSTAESGSESDRRRFGSRGISVAIVVDEEDEGRGGESWRLCAGGGEENFIGPRNSEDKSALWKRRYGAGEGLPNRERTDASHVVTRNSFSRCSGPLVAERVGRPESTTVCSRRCWVLLGRDW